jgi:hypothetical protein
MPEFAAAVEAESKTAVPGPGVSGFAEVLAETSPGGEKGLACGSTPAVCLAAQPMMAVARAPAVRAETSARRVIPEAASVAGFELALQGKGPPFPSVRAPSTASAWGTTECVVRYERGEALASSTALSSVDPAG